jgi:hypothetical protein
MILKEVTEAEENRKQSLKRSVDASRSNLRKKMEDFASRKESSKKEFYNSRV